MVTLRSEGIQASAVAQPMPSQSKSAVSAGRTARRSATPDRASQDSVLRRSQRVRDRHGALQSIQEDTAASAGSFHASSLPVPGSNAALLHLYNEHQQILILQKLQPQKMTQSWQISVQLKQYRSLCSPEHRQYSRQSCRHQTQTLAASRCIFLPKMLISLVQRTAMLRPMMTF